MIIKLENKSGKERVISSIDSGSLQTYKVEENQTVEIECSENLAELECSGTVIFIPTVFEEVSYTLIEDKEIIQSRKQIDAMFLILLITVLIIIVLAIKASVFIIGMALVIQALILLGVYKVLRSEQKGEVVFVNK